MNERIKAIGRQAGLVFIEDGVYGQRWYSSKCGLDASEYEKLVQLIVKECIMQVADVRIENDFEPAGDKALVQAMNGIKNYFGVGQ